MGLFDTQKVAMKVLFIAATLALASADFAPTCDECNAAAQGLLDRLTSAESIAEQTGILISRFAHRLLMLLLARRRSPNTGVTWQCASTPLSLEPATLASALDSAR